MIPESFYFSPKFASALAIAVKNIPETGIILLGFASEICKNYYESTKDISGKRYAELVGFSGFVYAEQYFETWLSKNKKHIEKHGYETNDLAHWEQDITNFAAYNGCVSDSMRHSFSPFACYELLESLLSVEKKHRDKHSNKLYKNIINKFWPELMKYPVNPYLRDRSIVLMKKIRLYNTYRKVMTTFVRLLKAKQ